MAVSTPANPAPGARARTDGGFTLMESIISIGIVSCLLVMVLNTLGSQVKGRRVRASRWQAEALAHSLLAEIVQSPYKDPDETPSFGTEGAESDATRSDFDDVDDYDGLSVQDTTSVGATYTITASVYYVEVSAPDSAVSYPTFFKRLDVTVSSPFLSRPITLSHLFSYWSR